MSILGWRFSSTLLIGFTLCLLGLALCLLRQADARHLAKWEARLEAELEAIEFSLSKPWSDTSDIGRCVRKSRRRVDCFGEISGTQLIDCSGITLRCWYRQRRCTFKVIVYVGWVFKRGTHHK